jgi:hypothetical protein
VRRSIASKVADLNWYRIQLVGAVEKLIKKMKADDVRGLWEFSIKKWL